MDRIVHATAVDIGGGKRGFRSKDTVAGVPGTVVTAVHMNASQEEIVRAIELGGETPSGADLEQLWKVIQKAGTLGQCQLRYVSATSITLVPKDGNLVKVAGKAVVLPSAGVSAANTAVLVNGVAGNLAASTEYLVALNAVGALEFWTKATGHTRDTTAGNVGIEVIAGHADKTLVGMVCTNASSQFALSASFLGVISWFNRRSLSASGVPTSGSSTASPTFVEINTVCRATFLTWADEGVSAKVVGQAANGTTAFAVTAKVGIDGVHVGIAGTSYTASGGQSSFTGGFYDAQLSEGVHIISPFGAIGGGGTGVFDVAATVNVRG